MPPNSTDVRLSDAFRFLVVDDHDFMRRLVNETLRVAGAGTIENAVNGQDAIKVISKSRGVDFVICDFNMPKVNGLELLKTIRTGETKLPHDVPVIMLSGFEDETLFAIALQLDASGFINKPVSKIDLVTRLNKLFMSEMEIKPSSEYIPVQISAIEGEFERKGPAVAMRAVPRVSMEVKARGLSVSIDEIPEGALVVEDVVTASGVTILHEGNKTSKALIEFLMQTRDITDISKIVIYEDG